MEKDDSSYTEFFSLVLDNYHSEFGNDVDWFRYQMCIQAVRDMCENIYRIHHENYIGDSNDRKDLCDYDTVVNNCQNCGLNDNCPGLEMVAGGKYCKNWTKETREASCEKCTARLVCDHVMTGKLGECVGFEYDNFVTFMDMQKK